MSKIIIVDEKDNVIGSRERIEVRNNTDYIYRVSVLWITNSRDEILLARRALTKDTHPGKWGPAVAGTLEEGETYESNIIKEAEEELGIRGIKPMEVTKYFVVGKSRKFWQIYSLKLDMDASEFVISKDEVAEVRWFTKKELLEKFKNNPDDFISSFDKLMRLFI